jgi:hypothetical protein
MASDKEKPDVRVNDFIVVSSTDAIPFLKEAMVKAKGLGLTDTQEAPLVGKPRRVVALYNPPEFPQAKHPPFVIVDTYNRQPAISLPVDWVKVAHRPLFDIGDRVELIETPVIDDEHKPGWKGCKHFLIKGAVGTISTVEFKGYSIKFDGESLVSSIDETVNPTPKENRTSFYFPEHMLQKVETEKPGDKPMNDQKLTHEVVADWAADPNILKRTDYENPEDIRILQLLLQRFKLYDNVIDELWGGGTDSAVHAFQEIMLLEVDGWVGEGTKGRMLQCFDDNWESGKPWNLKVGELTIPVLGGCHPDLGALPSTSGKVSHFGGPDDGGDRCYGQALFWTNPSNPLENLPAIIKEQLPEIVKLGLFRDDLPDGLPMTTDWNGRICRAGLSWCLNPQSYYLAMRWDRDHYPNTAKHRVLIWYKDKAVVVTPSDWGPHVKTKKNADLSNGAIDAIEAKTGDWCYYAWVPDNTPLGPVE